MSRRYWNYRVIAFDHPTEPYSRIHEVHYEDDKPVAYGEATPQWDGHDVAAGRVVLGQMLEALDKPAIRRADFPDGGEEDAAPVQGD